MVNRMPRVVGALAATLLAAVLASGCTSDPAGSPGVQGSASTSAVTSPTLEASSPAVSGSPSSSGALESSEVMQREIAVPLLALSGSVVDDAGNSLHVELELTGIDAVTPQDLAAIDATWCGDGTATADLDGPDARIVTFDVDVTASDGFPGWSDDRGILVQGDLFDGPIWEQPATVTGCVPDSRVVRPGSGTARVAVSSVPWGIPPVGGDGAVSLALYGFVAQAIGSDDQPTGTAVVEDCEIEPAPELDAMAMSVAPAIAWGNASVLPEHCLYGRMSGDW